MPYVVQKSRGRNSTLSFRQMNQAEDFHDSLFVSNNRHITDLVETCYVYSTNIDTNTHINMSEIISSDSYNKTMDRESKQDGDRLVPKWSAALGGIYAETTYQITGDHMASIYSGYSVIYCKLILGKYTPSSNGNFVQGYQ